MKAIMGLLVFSFLLQTSLIAEEGFPLREKYKAYPYITLEDLTKEYDSVIIIDVRSKFEFEVVKVNKAKNILVSKATFLKEVEKIRAKGGAQKIAFYCNGHTCEKSYKAAKKAIDAGFKNIFIFDAGVFDWIRANGDKGTLLGESPVDTKKIISKANFTAKCLDYAKFSEAATKSGAMIIDVRDPIQREKKLSIKGIKNIPLDRMKALVKGKKFQDKHLLIFDAVGKQVKWLQYYLEENGYKNYSFLTKGVTSAPKEAASK